MSDRKAVVKNADMSGKCPPVICHVVKHTSILLDARGGWHSGFEARPKRNVEEGEPRSDAGGAKWLEPTPEPQGGSGAAAFCLRLPQQGVLFRSVSQTQVREAGEAGTSLG